MRHYSAFHLIKQFMILAASGACIDTDQCEFPAQPSTRQQDYACDHNHTDADGCADSNYGVT